MARNGTAGRGGLQRSVEGFRVAPTPRPGELRDLQSISVFADLIGEAGAFADMGSFVLLLMHFWTMHGS